MASGRSMSGRKAAAEAGFLSNLEPRERKLVMLLMGVALLVFGAVLFSLRMSKTKEIDKEIDDLREAVGLVRSQGPSYQDKLKRKATREAQISDQPIIFGTVVEKAEKIAEVEVAGQEEQTPIDVADNLRKRVFTFDLRRVPLASLVKLLSTIESEKGRVVYTERLLIRSTSETEDLVNAEVELATLERTAAEAEEGEAEEEQR